MECSYQLCPDQDQVMVQSVQEPEVSVEVTPRKALNTETPSVAGPIVTNIPLFKNDIEVEVVKVSHSL